MKIPVNGKLYGCNVCARTVIKFWIRFKVSFLDAWCDPETDFEKRKLLLKQLFYVSADIEEPFADFSEQADADEDFILNARSLKAIIFECNLDPVKNPVDYGIPSGEITFLANFASAGLPDCWLDQFKYFDIIAIIQRKSMIENPKTYETARMTQEESNEFFGITKDREESISKYILEHPEEFK